MSRDTHAIWAIDAEESNAKINKTVFRYLKSLNKNVKDLKITPCTLLPLGDFGFHEVLTPREINTYKLRSKDLADELLAKAGAKDLEVDIVVAKERSASQLVDFLVSRAKKVKADLVVLGAHQRSAGERFFLGSFTENFLFHGKLPGLIIPVEASIPRNGVKLAMVCADLYNNYKDDFAAALDYLERFGIKELIIYHGLPFSRAHVYHKDFIEEKIAERQKDLDDLKRSASSRGFKVRIELSSGKINLSADITKKAKRAGANLIIMKGKTSRARSTFVGSTTRSVLRESQVPVLVFH